MLVRNSLGSSVEGRFWVQQLCVRAGGGEGSRDALVSALCRALVLPTSRNLAGVMFSGARLMPVAVHWEGGCRVYSACPLAGHAGKNTPEPGNQSCPSKTSWSC